MVKAGAVDEDGLSVETEALLGIIFYSTYAKGHVHLVENGAVVLCQCQMGGVHLRLLRRPQTWLGNVEECYRRHPPVLVQELDIHLLRLVAHASGKHQPVAKTALLIHHRSLDAQLRLAVGHAQGDDADARALMGSKMNVATLLKPHVAIDAGARIPATVGLVGVIHVHNHLITSQHQIRRDVHSKRGVSVVVVPGLITVHVDISTLIHALEVEFGMGSQTLEHEGLAIFGHAALKPAAACACGT